MTDPQGLLKQATAHHEAGRLDVAEPLYRALLALDADDAAANHGLGALLIERGQHEPALVYLQRAVEQSPETGRYWEGWALGMLIGHSPQAAQVVIEQAIALGLDTASGDALRDQIAAAIAKTDNPIDVATPAEREAAVALILEGRFEAADALARQLMSSYPDDAFGWEVAAGILVARDEHQAALPLLRQAISLAPEDIECLYNLGCVLQELGRPHEALGCFTRALEIDPNYAKAHNNMGGVLKDLGRLDEALVSYERALELKSETDKPASNSNRLFVLNYHPDKSAEEIFAAYRDFDRRFGEPHRSSWRPHTNDPDPARRLRLGYISPDFRNHSARHFLEPLLTCHDRQSVEITAYAELKREDDLTARYRSSVDHWVPTRGLTDDELAERIRADGIDILVDLAGHTSGNRLGVFARRPAPVSVSWLGYGYTTGLSAIDYFLTDPVLTPEGAEPLFAEQPWRISSPWAAYRPAEGMGEVGALPALDRGVVTFGTLTRGVRINHRTIRVWSAILRRLPETRLMIDSKDFASAEARTALAGRFAVHGVRPERLALGFHSPPWDLFRGMDIGLDSFPHNSGTTLIETLYMGVPFITLAERPSVGRIGSTILAGAGHPEWIAASESEYIEKAVELASDLDHLASIRAALRDELETGAWCDEQGFARRVEQAYREMWQRWCASESRAGG